LAREKKTILVVGKPGHLRDALTGFMEAAEISEIQRADTALLGLKAVSDLKPDLVITTSGMQAEELVEFLRILRNTHPNTRCMVISDEMGQQTRLLKAGANWVFTRYASADTLISAVRLALA